MDSSAVGKNYSKKANKVEFKPSSRIKEMIIELSTKLIASGFSRIKL